MSRLAEQEDIYDILANIEQQLTELHHTQIVGSDVVRTEKLQSSLDWDLDFTVPADYIEITKTLTIRFVPDKPIDGKPPAAFRVGVRQLATGNYQWIDNLRMRPIILRKQVIDPLAQEWNVNVPYNGGYGVPIRFQLKFYVLATGKGTVTIV